MNAIALHDAFVGAGCAGPCEPQPAVSIEAGAIWRQAYDAVTTKGGPLRPGRRLHDGRRRRPRLRRRLRQLFQGLRHGRGEPVEAEIVTADGEVKIANACSESRPLLGAQRRRRRVRRRHARDPAHPCAPRIFRRRVRDRSRRRPTTPTAASSPKSSNSTREALFNPHWGEQIALRARLRRDFNGLPGARPAAGGGGLEAVLRLGRRFAAGFRLRGGAADPRAAGAAFLGPVVSQAFPASSSPTIGRARRRTTSSGPETSTRRERLARLPIRVAAGFAARSRTGAKASPMRFLPPRSTGAWRCMSTRGLAGAPAEAIAAAKDTAMNPAVVDAFALVISGALGQPAYPGVPGHEPDTAVARSSGSRPWTSR